VTFPASSTIALRTTVPSAPSLRASAGYFGAAPVTRRFCAPCDERMIAVFSPGSGALEGDELEVAPAALFAVSCFVSAAGLLMTGAAVGVLAEALGLAATAEDGDDGSETAADPDVAVDAPAVGAAAVDGADETDSGADAPVAESEGVDCAVPESAGAGAAIGAG